MFEMLEKKMKDVFIKNDDIKNNTYYEKYKNYTMDELGDILNKMKKEIDKKKYFIDDDFIKLNDEYKYISYVVCLFITEYLH